MSRKDYIHADPVAWRRPISHDGESPFKPGDRVEVVFGSQALPVGARGTVKAPVDSDNFTLVLWDAPHPPLTRFPGGVYNTRIRSVGLLDVLAEVSDDPV